jgi:hypothetical protein
LTPLIETIGVPMGADLTQGTRSLSSTRESAQLTPYCRP